MAIIYNHKVDNYKYTYDTFDMFIVVYVEEVFIVEIHSTNYSDLTQPHPKTYLSKGNPLIAKKSGLVKYHDLARHFWYLWYIWGIVQESIAGVRTLEVQLEVN